MARQAIPRFDLYAALGVDPSADDAAIEAAYWDLFGQYGGDAEASDDRRIVRARLAREWLTDPDRRSRYDASRARAAARSAAKAAGYRAAAGAIGASEVADEVDDEELAEDTIPWPAADLERQAAADRLAAMERQAAEVEQSESSIKWSATPAAAVEPDDRGPRRRSATRPRRRQLRFIGWGAVIVAGIAAAFLVFSTLGGTDVANRETPTPPPIPTAAPATPTALPTTEPTVQPTSPPPTAPGIDIAALQQASWNTMQSLIAAAGDGDVDTAQSILGGTAPGLRASGLRRATFPDVTAQQMTITQDVAGYVALADETTRLTSTDGQTWTFDYGDRPLAAYLGGTTPHDLWWTEGNTKHHIYLRLSGVTVSKGGVTITAKWKFDPSLPNDATYFQRAGLRISAFAAGDAQLTLQSSPLPMAGVTSLTTTSPASGGTVPEKMILTIEVTNPRADGTNDRAIETDFVLTVR